MGDLQESRLRNRVRKLKWRLVIVVGGICIAAIVAMAISIDIFDDFTRREVRERVEAVYFARLLDYVAEEVKKTLRNKGCGDNPEAVAAALDFLNEESGNIALVVHEPEWGWRKERYRFTISWRNTVVHEPEWGWRKERYRVTISWRNTWIAKFKLSESNEAIGITTNDVFERRLTRVVCGIACKVGCRLCTVKASCRARLKLVGHRRTREGGVRQDALAQ